MEPHEAILAELQDVKLALDNAQGQLAERDQQHNFGPELAASLAKAQGEVKHALKSAHNPFLNAQYADLGMVVDAARGPLAKNGLSVTQLVRVEPGRNDRALLDTYLIHETGQWIKSTYPIYPCTKEKGKGWVHAPFDLQAWGSATTYARKYAYAAIVGVATEDLDAEQPGRPGTPEPQQQRPQPQQRSASREQGPQVDRDFAQGQQETGEAASEADAREVLKRLVASGRNTKGKMLEFVNEALGEHGPVDGLRNLSAVQAKIVLGKLEAK